MTEPLPEEARRRLLASAAPLVDEAADANLVSGRYRLVSELGRGGMGVVWQAVDEELGREVALKILERRPGSHQELRERFLREARSAARLSHPGIAAVYDADERAIAMQLVRGAPLSEAPAPTPEDAARWIRDAARAVHYAHENGVIHRDLKPHNLLLEGERVLVTDFGLAKDALASTELSQSGSLLGTPAYMAPEQARGGGAVDARTDVWGLGATLFDLVCGRPPFVGSDLLDVLRRIGEETPPAPSRLRAGLARDLELVIHKALERDPERRYPSARALADDLHRWLEGRPVLARAPSLAYRTTKFAARHRLPLALASVSLLATAIAWGTWLARRAAAEASDSALAMSNRVAVVLDDADKYQKAGEIERAHERLDAAIEAARDLARRHDNADGHVLLGRLLATRERRDEALAAFERALFLKPDMVQARVGRGLLRARECAARAASARYLGPAGADEGSLEQLRAAALADLKLSAEELTELRRIDQLRVQAETAGLNAELERAESLWLEVLRLDHVHADAKLALREIELSRGNPDAALAHAMSALDVMRGYAPAYVARAETDLPGDPARARRDTSAGLALEGMDSAFVDLAPLLAKRPSDALAQAHRGQMLCLRAAELTTRGEPQAALETWNDAIEAFDGALTLEPDLAVIQSNRGVAHGARSALLESLGRHGEAQTAKGAAATDFRAALIGDIDPALRARLKEELESRE